MSDDRDPMHPESWFGEPNICGSCIAWRAGDPKPGEEVAAGICKLRSELPRVPATMPKCYIYKPRGQFTYEPERVSSPKRRKNKVLKVIRVDKDGTETTTQTRAAASPIRERPARAPAPATLDLGDLESLPVVKQALIEMIRHEFGRSRREMHSKYARGGTVTVRSGDLTRTVRAEAFFAMLDRLQSSISSLDASLKRHSEALGSKSAADMRSQLSRMRGSLTTFNVMFEHREDYFSSK